MIRHYAPAYEPGLAKIVLVDHEQDFVDRTSALLNTEGFLCRGFTTIESAAESVAIESPDVLLVGMERAAGSKERGALGMQLLLAPRSLPPAMANLPVVFLSTTQIPDIVHRCDGGHGSYSVRKSLEIGVLVELIEQILPVAAACVR